MFRTSPTAVSVTNRLMKRLLEQDPMALGSMIAASVVSEGMDQQGEFGEDSWIAIHAIPGIEADAHRRSIGIARSRRAAQCCIGASIVPNTLADGVPRGKRAWTRGSYPVQARAGERRYSHHGT